MNDCAANSEMSKISGRADIVIGLIGAVGTHLHSVEKAIENDLKTYAYQYELIKLSKLIKQYPGYTHLDKTKMHRRDYYNEAINGGNAIRDKLKNASALVQWAVLDIMDHRARPLENHLRGRCFVIDQIKTPEEVRFLREVYGSLFYCIATYADEAVRQKRLTREFEEDRHEQKEKGAGPAAAARAVIERDHREKGDFGQNVRKAFVEADYFVRSDEQLDIQKAIDRFFFLVFDKPYVSPTKSEIAMMHAKTAALRSADLSRQIGATIVSRDGRLITTGCNEVPKAGGGQYWENDVDDTRDWVLGYDANDKKKRQGIIELIDALNDKFKSEYLEADFPENIYDGLVKADRLQETLVDSLIEFGRIVHAEQAAMNTACMSGVAIRDADLYCTTYPCHMCARQIVNCGIRNVFYIEPYPKSQVTELYEDSIDPNPKLTRKEYLKRLNDPNIDVQRVFFIPFEGVAPRRYGDLFSNKRRKEDNGEKLTFNPLEAKPRSAPTYYDPTVAEDIVKENIGTQVDEWVAAGKAEITAREARGIGCE